MLGAGADVAAGQQSAAARRAADDVRYSVATPDLRAGDYGAASKREVLYDARLATGRRSRRGAGRLRAVRSLADPARWHRACRPSDVGECGGDRALVAGGRAARDARDRRAKRPIRGFVTATMPWCRNAFGTRSARTPCCDRAAIGSPIQFWIAPTGTVEQARLLGKTGDARVDGAIETTLRGLKMKEAPAAGHRRNP